MKLIYIFIIIKSLNLYADLIDESSPKFEIQTINKEVEKKLDTLTLEEKIGQMLMYGFKGYDISDVKKLVTNYKVGGFIIFSHNVKDEKQFLNLTQGIRNYSLSENGIPSFIAVDQEGGRVLRLKNFATVLPGNMNLGASRSRELSYLAGKLTAVDLEMLGVNMNLAPVLDINTSAKNTVIGVRSFGSNPEMVSELGSAYIKGLQFRKVIATAKHFPGHGATDGDSHFETLNLNKNLEAMKEMEFQPFIRAIKENVDAIMTAHIVAPKLDPSLAPATLSYPIITEILRKQLGFKGLVVTDDMEMRAITKNNSIGDAAIRAILAGCDIITVIWTDNNKNSAYQSILRAVKTGKISEKRIDESVRRILFVKLKRGFYDVKDPNIENVRQIVGNKFHQEVSKVIANKSITLVKNIKKLIPISKKNKIVVISPFEYLSSELRKTGLENTFIAMDVKLNSHNRNQIIKTALKYKKTTDLYIVAVVDETQTSVARLLKQYTEKQVVVASLDSPYLYSSVRNADAYLCTYSFRTQVIEALANVISGKFRASGVLPVNL